MDLILIPAGSFVMGSTATELGRYPEDWLPHTVTITKDFYLGKYEVTKAEWEYACRNGSNTRFSFGDTYECEDNEDVYCPQIKSYMCWWGKNTINGNANGTKEIGLTVPNPWGLIDMHGNVWEWCLDWWQESCERGAQIDP